MTALDYSIQRNDIDCVKLLLAAGASPFTKDVNHRKITSTADRIIDLLKLSVLLTIVHRLQPKQLRRRDYTLVFRWKTHFKIDKYEKAHALALSNVNDIV